MGKAPLILQYLHDHARLICDRKNDEDGPGTWRITPIPDDQRRNIIFHYGSTENFQEFFSNVKPQKEPEKVESPTLNDCEINLKSLERREMMRMTEKKFTRQKSRLTIKRNTQDARAPNTGIFSNGIQANRILIPKEEAEDKVEDCDYPYNNFTNKDNNVINQVPILSTSSIYLHPDSSDYDNEIFNEPDDFESAQFYHDCDFHTQNNSDWFDDTVNYIQSQRTRGGFIQRHADYYHNYNSQR